LRIGLAKWILFLLRATNFALAKIKAWGIFSMLHAFISGSEGVGKLLGFSTPAGTGSGLVQYFPLLIFFFGYASNPYLELWKSFPKQNKKTIRDSSNVKSLMVSNL
tara:strand:- start:126 stop:443 length:318 start_codon:yes stop_codon:yes gene_type:complete